MSVFNKVQVRKPNSNTFNLSHDLKFTQRMGNLTPILVQEVLPGDRFTIDTQTLIRFAPLVAPVMHSVKVYTHYFFVPNRIVWPNWESFISPDLSKENPPAAPTLQFAEEGVFEKSTLADYFGLPTDVDVSWSDDISAIPFAAYNKIYNEYYRDQNLQGAVPDLLTDGNTNIYYSDNPMYFGSIYRRAWQHDYFTSALPFAQKGPSVDLPLGQFEDVPVHRNNSATGNSYWDSTSGLIGQIGVDNVNNAEFNENMLYADTSQLVGSAATINDLRVAFRLQEWFEKAARGGSRYVEQLLVHWAVRSSDARLNRPEFLGGSINPVIISEVLQTSESADTPQATIAGHGISAGSGKKIRYRAEEHGYIIGIQSIMPTTAYQQGLPRHFTRSSWEDYAWPTFAHLGEQEILNKEIYYDHSDGKNDETFGYIPRYSEYRYTPSRVAGDFKGDLAFWHLGRIFDNRPRLTAEFIECNPREDIFAVRDDENQHLWCHSFHKVYVNRKLPKYGTPTL